VWWSGAEEDVIPAGDSAKGYVAAGFNVAGADYPVIREIRKHVYAAGHGEMEAPSRIGSIYYNRGVVFGIITAEAVRVAQERSFRANAPAMRPEVSSTSPLRWRCIAVI
jgi:branched-chain amino acid transport system substrate-binding protein